MSIAFAPDFAETNGDFPSHDDFTPAPGTPPAAQKQPPYFSDAHARIEEIEQLYAAGFSTYDIAEALGLRPRDVGRNLRETRNRHQRAARRQSEALAISQCAAIHREAMAGWRSSQEQRLVLTTRTKSGEPDVVTTRTENRPGSASFLNTALRAVKQLRQIADIASGQKASGRKAFGQKAAATIPAMPNESPDAVHFALLDVLTPQQLAALGADRVQRIRESYERWKEVVDAVTEARRESDEPLDETQEDVPDFAEDEAALAEQSELSEPEETASADVENDTATDDLVPHAANGTRRPSARPESSQPRHPEWPADSFLSRSWLPPDDDFAVNRGENDVPRPAEVYERNGHAQSACP
jgi:hypothetical protein